MCLQDPFTDNAGHIYQITRCFANITQAQRHERFTDPDLECISPYNYTVTTSRGEGEWI